MLNAPQTESSGAEYRFGCFRLNPKGHELWRGSELVHVPRLMFDCLSYLIEHRDRVVGRDELVSAVWGRIDVADAQVRQLIARVRTLIDGDGSDPSAIRTVPGVGYRWIMGIDTAAGRVEITAVEAPSSLNEDEAGSRLPSESRLRRTTAVVAVIVLFAAAIVVFWNFVGHRDAGAPSTAEGSGRAIVVLPLDISGPDDVAWVRLGALDLIANRMRSGGLPVPPSESVVSALHAIGEPLDAGRLTKLRETLGAATLVQGTATKSALGWKVSLATTLSDGTRHTSEADRLDVTDAAGQAADLLITSLGYPVTPGKNENVDELQEILQRAQAALLANHLDIARSILLGGPAPLQNDPQIRLKLAQVDQRAGKQDEADVALKSLLADPIVTSRPTLHARALNLLATIAFRRQDCVTSEHNAREAVRLLLNEKQPVDLGQALTTRALANVCMDHFDIALEDLGKARTQAEAAGDRLGIAGVDHTMGKLELQRNRPGESIPYLVSADGVFASIGAVEPLIANLAELYYAQTMLLRRVDALTTSERLWSMRDQARDPGRRMYLGVIRSDALTATGRYAEADVVLAQLENAEAAIPKTEARSLYAARADLDWHRGQVEKALVEIDQALASFLDAPGPDEGERAALRLERQRISIAAGKPVRAEMPPYVAGNTVLLPLQIAYAEWSAHEGKIEEADEAFRQASTSAEADGVPEQIAMAAQAYGTWLLSQKRTDEAASQAGRVALWSDQDYDSALLQVAVFHALGQTDAWTRALKQVHSLAGERAVPDELQLAPTM